MAAEEQSRVVLPVNVKPSHYYIAITTNFTDLTFTGTCTVDLLAQEDTTSITFNSLDITYQSITVGDETVDVSTLEFEDKLQYCTLNLQNSIPAGTQFQMVCEYTGEINDKMKGFYRSKYKKDGVEVFGGVTQFESTDARRAFPCWDEPNVKAQYTVEITTNDYFTVASNMPCVEEKENSDATKTYVFEKSPIMSSYLVAWVIGEYELVETQTQRGIVVRCYTPVGKREQGTFAADFGAKCLDWYEEYFQFNYPLPKCDMFAIGDFAAGAMENWGLVTYRESRVLVSDKTGPVDRMFVCQVVAHELAHQWFGNLVTMDWWKELWLNEGFANFMESYCCDALTDYDYRQFFVTKSFSRALDLDSLLSSHPIEVDVQTAEEVDEIFDAISYCKGGSTVRMIQNYLGAETFRNGLRTYMQEHQYSNTVTTDLWRHLGAAAELDVASVMANWTGNQGYPIVTATLTEDNKVKLVQNRFLSSGVASAEQDTVVWNIPIVALTGEGESRFLMTDREMVTDIVLDGGNDWIHLNHGLCGIYRVNYSNVLLQRLSSALVSGSIVDPLDRYGIVSDLLALAQNGTTSLTQLLEILPSFKTETELCVWQVISNVSGSISKIIAGEEVEPVFLTILADLVSQKHQELGFDKVDGESNETEILRELVIGLAAKAEIPTTMEEIKARFWNVFNDNVELDGSIRGTIFNNAVKYGGQEEFDKMLDELDNCESQGLMREYISACCRTKDLTLVDRILEYNMTDKIRNNMKVYIWAYLSYNQTARDRCWEFVSSNWADLYALYEGGFLVNWLAKVPAKFNTLEKAKEVEEFFDTVRESSPAANRAMTQTIEEITLTGTWRERELPALKEYLGNYSS